jgi:hypothetical protein
MVQVRDFPELSTATKLIRIDHVSVQNVEMWRWVVGLELGLLSAVLLHMSLGIGALNVAFALMWMFVGLGIYRSVGTMHAAKELSEALTGRSVQGASGAASGPLVNWGMPLAERPRYPVADGPVSTESGLIDPRREGFTPGLGPAPASAAETARSRDAAMIPQVRERIVNEVAPLAWMYVTAICGGIIAVTGLRMLIHRSAFRLWMCIGLWLGLGVGAAALWSVWPKGPDQTWAGWFAAFRLSRYHVYAIWLAFLLSMAVFGSRALRSASDVRTWLHASVAATLLATAASIGGIAVMIEFGRFPHLPAWVYIVLAAGQSSLAWVLLMSAALSGRRSAAAAPGA